MFRPEHTFLHSKNFRRKILENILRIYFYKNGRKILIYILELSAQGNCCSGNSSVLVTGIDPQKPINKKPTSIWMLKPKQRPKTPPTRNPFFWGWVGFASPGLRISFRERCSKDINPLVPSVPHGGTISGGGDFPWSYSFTVTDLDEYDTKK